MVLSNNVYGARGKGCIPMAFLSIAVAAIATGLSVAMVREYQEQKKGAEAFSKEKDVRLVKVEHTANRHGSSDSLYFDTDRDPETFEYYAYGPKAENAKEGQVKSGDEFMKENPKMHFYKSEGR